MIPSNSSLAGKTLDYVISIDPFPFEDTAGTGCETKQNLSLPWRCKVARDADENQ